MLARKVLHTLARNPAVIRRLATKAAGNRPLLTQVNANFALQIHRRHYGAVPSQEFMFRQFFDNRTYTYTYLLADPETKDAVLIDPVLELAERDASIVNDLGLNLIYAINTHVHADHVTGTGELKKRIKSCKSVIAEPKAKADVHIKHGDVIKFGSFQLECRSTPGHTDGCTTYVWHEKGMAFTGDALLIRGCGRTDFQQGNSKTLYESVHGQILSLPENFLLYPAHDYTGQTVTTVAEEKKYNPRLTKDINQFVKIMEDLKLPYPKEIERALPANMVCGVF
jgi:sulfur dioxygenase